MDLEQIPDEAHQKTSALSSIKNFFTTQYLYIPFFVMMIVLTLPTLLFIGNTIQNFKKIPELPKAIETSFNDSNPLKSTLTNLNNQFYYSLFSKSLMYDSNIIVGKKGFLYEKAYIDAYTNYPKSEQTQQTLDKWAENLQELSDFFAKRGQKLVYIITPSKASYYPEYLPEEFASLIHNPRPNYYLKINALQKIHVPYVDASQLMLDLKSDPAYGPLLFPRGGTHWTMLGAVIAANKMLALLSEQMDMDFPPLSYTYSTTRRPLGTDKDLLSLCKLIFPPHHYIIPFVDFKAQDQQLPLKVALIGGSFTHFFTEIFAKTRYFSQLDQYYYLIINHFRISKEGVLAPVAFNPYDPISYSEISSANLVILEENESIAYSNHFKALYTQLLGKLPG